MREKPRKSSITNIEKNRIVQTTVIVREVLSEISRTRNKTIWEVLKHPLLLLLVGSLASGVIVYKYQNRQSKIAESVKAKDELLKEISVITGRLLAMSKEVLNLHQKPIKDEEQIIATNKAYNEAGALYYSSLLKIEHSLRVIFKKEDMIKGWSGIRVEFEELNDCLDLLHEFKTTEISLEHSKRIDMCKNKIRNVSAKLNQYGSVLVENLD